MRCTTREHHASCRRCRVIFSPKGRRLHKQRSDSKTLGNSLASSREQKQRRVHAGTASTATVFAHSFDITRVLSVNNASAAGPSHVVGRACSRPARGLTRSPPARRQRCCCCWCAAVAFLQEHPLALDGGGGGSARRPRTLATRCGPSTKASACR